MSATKQQAAPKSRHLALRVAGDSFAPDLRAGDVALVRLGGIVGDASLVLVSNSGGYAIRRRATLRSGDTVLGCVTLRWPRGES